ncbi:hypothetical protein GCM10020258_16480 [Sphingomonas yabuuchiae]
MLLLVGGIAFAGDLGAWHIGIRQTTMANATLFGNSATFIFPLYGFWRPAPGRRGCRGWRCSWRRWVRGC